MNRTLPLSPRTIAAALLLFTVDFAGEAIARGWSDADIATHHRSFAWAVAAVAVGCLVLLIARRAERDGYRIHGMQSGLGLIAGAAFVLAVQVFLHGAVTNFVEIHDLFLVPADLAFVAGVLMAICAGASEYAKGRR